MHFLVYCGSVKTVGDHRLEVIQNTVSAHICARWWWSPCLSLKIFLSSMSNLRLHSGSGSTSEHLACERLELRFYDSLMYLMVCFVCMYMCMHCVHRCTCWCVHTGTRGGWKTTVGTIPQLCSILFCLKQVLSLTWDPPKWVARQWASGCTFPMLR